MSRQKPFTKRERQRMCDNRFGWRPRNDWGGGDLPAPFAEGDVVKLVGARPDRLKGWGVGDHCGPYFVVCYATSIDKGDAWYFRVWDGAHDSRSDRLHVAWADRCEGFAEDVDWMSCFELVETADPDGLHERSKLLAEGWSYESVGKCPSCGHPLPRKAK